MITDIHLQHFRSYDDASFEFDEGVTIIVGPNGSGKTNLLEALLVIAQGSSYRVNDADLLNFNADWTRLDAHADGVVRTVKLQAGTPTKKNYEIADKPYVRLPQERKLPVVLFEPNHLTILQNGPDGRRNYLDDILEQIKPGYTSFRKNYKRVLAQRNALLKHPRANQQDFFPWDLRLSELGAVTYRARTELVGRLNEAMGSLYRELSHGEVDVRVWYESKFSADGYESQLLRALESHRQQDIERGFTAYGPHRDDMQVLFNEKPAQLVASRGEVRTATLALKIMELQELQHATGAKPLLLLDDVFSELDGARRRALTAYLQQYQTFLTTTDADVVVKHFTDSSIIPLSLK